MSERAETLFLMRAETLFLMRAEMLFRPYDRKTPK